MEIVAEISLVSEMKQNGENGPVVKRTLYVSRYII